MKKHCLLLLIVVVSLFCASAVYAQTLDSAINEAADGISNRLPAGTTVAVINFQSSSSRLADYVINELNGKLANIGKVRPVDRRQLDSLRAEINFNMSGEVSDSSAQNIGRMLGSQYIVSGSIEIIGSQYRIRLQAIAVETASIEYSFSQNVRSDPTLQALLGTGNESQDYTMGQRIGMGALNMFFGIGSTMSGQKLGWVTAIGEGVGLFFLVGGLIMPTINEEPDPNKYGYQDELDTYNMLKQTGTMLVITGASIIGVSVVFGYIIPFFHHKPNTTVAAANFPFSLDLVPVNNQDVGIRISYTMRF
jgi:TolB-like protein